MMLSDVDMALARSERFELPTLGIEIRCSIQLSYERVMTDQIRATPDIRLERARPAFAALQPSA